MRIIAAAITIAVVAAALLVCFSLKKAIIVTDAKTGRLYGAWAADEGDVFEITFVHSVNKSPVTDCFRVSGRRICAFRTVYSAFGAGMPDVLPEGQTLSSDKDGNMVIDGIDLYQDELRYIVGTVYDHILTVQGRQVSLTQLCGRNANIRVHVGYTLFLKG